MKIDQLANALTLSFLDKTHKMIVKIDPVNNRKNSREAYFCLSENIFDKNKNFFYQANESCIMFGTNTNSEYTEEEFYEDEEEYLVDSK
jgi:hypothetical protein